MIDYYFVKECDMDVSDRKLRLDILRKKIHDKFCSKGLYYPALQGNETGSGKNSDAQQKY